MTTQYAAIENGAVFGMGSSVEAAIADARKGSRDDESTYEVVEISAEAAAYVNTHGGEPSHRLMVGRSGVMLRCACGEHYDPAVDAAGRDVCGQCGGTK